MDTLSTSFNASAGSDSAIVAASGTSAQSASYDAGAGKNFLITPMVSVYYRWGTNPTALATGADQLLVAGNTYRIKAGGIGKFAFIALAGSGNVHITVEG